MNKLIKLVHHLQNVDPGIIKEQPKMINKMVDMLSTMIRPAAPTEDTAQLIKGNADNWGYTTLVILKQHYQAGIRTTSEEISEILVQDWKEQFQLAARWAKKNLPHIKQEAIDHAEALIIAENDGSNQPQVPTIVQPRQRQQANVTVATMTEGTGPGIEQATQGAHPLVQGEPLLAVEPPSEPRN
ncbi:hypothetical protein F2P81_025655 [Scomber scombrus]|uniref:Gag protein n=1 Tax=Scomber scombrus TaxID=13677 RepID=A0AAV1QL31_SCOSC